jgi:alpha-1,2-mannosyltransferase
MKPILYPSYVALIALLVVYHQVARRYRFAPAIVSSGYILWGIVTCTFMILASEPLDWFYEFRIGYWHAARHAFTDPVHMYGAGQFAFVNLPVLALPFLPFAGLGPYQAGVVFCLLAGGLAALSWLQLVRLAELDAPNRWLLAGLFVLSGPLFYCLRQGNSTILILPLLTAALAALVTGQGFRAGMLLGVAGLIKPPLLLLPAYYTLRLRWRVTAGSALVGAMVLGASLLWFGADVHRAWYECCIKPFTGRALVSYTAQSLSSLMARWSCTMPADDIMWLWWPIPVSARFRALHTLLAGCLAGAALLPCWSRSGQKQDAAERLNFCLVLCLALVTSPVCWTHYYLLLLIPAAILLGPTGGSQPTRGRLIALGFAFFIMSFPVRGWSIDRLGLSLLVSHYFAGGLCLMAILIHTRWKLGRLQVKEDGSSIGSEVVMARAG